MLAQNAYIEILTYYITETRQTW